MAQQLFNRLGKVFSDEPWTHIHSARTAAGQGLPAKLTDVKTLVVHETTGWPTRVRGREMFLEHFVGGDEITTQLYVANDGTVLQGMELPRRTSHAGFLNDAALGMETGHSWGNYVGNSHLGPWTTTDERLVPDPAHPGKLKVSGALIPLQEHTGNAWVPLHGDSTMEDAGDDDLPGMKLYLRHRGLNEVLVAWWTTGRYNGPWRQPLRVPEMLFTEAQYRSWALTARYLAEQHLLPRNFPLLPHKTRTNGVGESGAHGTLNDAASFAAIVLADEALARSPATFSLPATPVPPTSRSLQDKYATGVTGTGDSAKNIHWQAMFKVLRGIIGHGFAGDPANGDHDCPGPLFDWHRFAREVWDWWWWPFDFDTARPTAAVAKRPYTLASRDGDTPLKEYYFSTPAATAQGRSRTGVHGATGSPQTFELPQDSRVYSLANGELVAARFPDPAGPVSMAFALVRHEVYHRLDTRTPNPTASPPVFANRIDYDVAPTSFYSLYMHLGRPAGLSFSTVSDGNPDWLNRLLIRKKECRLGLDFRATTAGKAIPASQFNNRPPGTPARPGVLDGWTDDNRALGQFLDALRAGRVAVAWPGANVTPIRVLLGDFLGTAGVIRSGNASPLPAGVRVEVFSTALLPDSDFGAGGFTFTDTSHSGGGWRPSSTTGAQVVRYQSEWARTPAGAEQLTLSGQGVDTRMVDWWGDVQLATLDNRLPFDAALPEDGVVHHYDPLTFLPWLNGRTWRSEWPKYRVTDASGGIPAAPRPR